MSLEISLLSVISLVLFEIFFGVGADRDCHARKEVIGRSGRGFPSVAISERESNFQIKGHASMDGGPVRVHFGKKYLLPLCKQVVSSTNFKEPIVDKIALAALRSLFGVFVDFIGWLCFCRTLGTLPTMRSVPSGVVIGTVIVYIAGPRKSNGERSKFLKFPHKSIKNFQVYEVERRDEDGKEKEGESSSGSDGDSDDSDDGSDDASSSFSAPFCPKKKKAAPKKRKKSSKPVVYPSQLYDYRYMPAEAEEVARGAVMDVRREKSGFDEIFEQLAVFNETQMSEFTRKVDWYRKVIRAHTVGSEEEIVFQKNLFCSWGGRRLCSRAWTCSGCSSTTCAREISSSGTSCSSRWTSSRSPSLSAGGLSSRK